MQRRTADGHPDGFWAINTLAMHIGWDAAGESTAGIDEVTTGDVNRGLTLDSYGDRIVVTAYDFAAQSQLRQVTIPNPSVPFAGLMAPEPEPKPETGGDTDPDTDTDPDPDAGPAVIVPSAGSNADTLVSQPGTLPRTGGEGGGLLWVAALACVALGGSALALRRRVSRS